MGHSKKCLTSNERSASAIIAEHRVAAAPVPPLLPEDKTSTKTAPRGLYSSKGAHREDRGRTEFHGPDL